MIDTDNFFQSSYRNDAGNKRAVQFFGIMSSVLLSSALLYAFFVLKQNIGLEQTHITALNITKYGNITKSLGYP